MCSVDYETAKSQATSMKLCYAQSSWAWFSTQALELQQFTNYGPPCSWNGTGPAWDLLCVAWRGPHYVLFEHSNFLESPQKINRNRMPWLYGRNGASNIYAGTDFVEFVQLIEQAGGQVFLDHQGFCLLHPPCET